ncbi:MAG: NTP transferase domain-containing protein, partial [Gemmatimonadetes bacterium]|nr:NTP transferase domain-containing protein [Gemmatimonadota bacterium]
ALSRGLFAARDAWAGGERDAARLVGAVRAELDRDPLVEEDYIELRELVALEPWTRDAGSALLAVAARVGPARLIDNVILEAPGAETGFVTRAGADGGVSMTDRKGMAVLLAAGEGKRMKSDLPKVLHPVAGVPLVARVAQAAKDAGMDRIVVIIGNRAELVRERFADSGWEFVEQTERLGTGDAVKRARKQLEEFDGDVLVLAGDVPLLEASTLRTLREQHHASGAAATVLTANLDDATGYGRIVRDAAGEFTGIVEHKDATEAQRAITEVNSSIYCFDAGALVSVLDRFSRDNAQGEEYLTDAIGLLRGDGLKVAAVAAATPDEILGVNTPDQLGEIEAILERRKTAEAS